MLEHSRQLEEKIRDGELVDDKTFFVLVLCGEGFHWRQRNLEDFVSFYRTGSHLADDPLSRMEDKYIAEKRITLDRTISRFACMNRDHFQKLPGRFNWNVQPPVF